MSIVYFMTIFSYPVDRMLFDWNGQVFLYEVDLRVQLIDRFINIKSRFGW